MRLRFYLKERKMKSKFRQIILSVLPSEKFGIQNLLFVASFALFFAYCFSIPTFSERMHYIPIACCGLMCASMGIYTFLYGKFKINALVMLLILFNIAMIVTHLINFNFNTFPKTIFLMSVVAFFLYEFLCTTKRVNSFLVAALFAGLVFAFVYIVAYRYEIFKLSNIFSKRLGSIFDNENEISKEFGFFCIISLAFLLKNKNLTLKIISGISTFLFLFLILTTGSISNLLTTIIVCFLTVLICQKSIKRKLIIGGVALGVIGLFILFVQLPFMSYFKNRIERIFTTIFNLGNNDKNFDGSSYDRLMAAITSFSVGFNRITFGFGFMSATSFTNNYIQAHNNFAELFLDFGAVGLVLYEAIIFIPLLKDKKYEEKVFALPILLYMLIFQLFLTTYYKKFEYIFFAYIYALLDQSLDTQFVVYHSNILRKRNSKTVVFEVIPNLVPVGGAETFVIDFISSCKKRYGKNIDIKLILLYENNLPESINNIRLSNIEIIQIGKRKGIDFRCSCLLRNLIFEYRPSIIHTHLFSLSTLVFALPFKKKRIKCFHTIHHNFHGDDYNQKLLRYLARRKYLTPVCVAQKPAEEYEKYFGFNPVCIENGINLERYSNKQPLSLRNIDFLVVGRFVEIKNQNYLLKLVNKEKKLQNYNFVFLGDGPDFESAKQYVKDQNLEKIIKFAGFVKDVNNYMSRSKVLVMPSLNEGNPIVINEAIASGMLVVGNDVGGIHDLLINSKQGVLSNIYNKNDFVNKMYAQIERANKTTKPIDLSNSLISIDSCVDKYLDLFEVSK